MPGYRSAAAPPISVVLPVHNAASSIRTAIDTVLGQTFPDFELIVVDDASTDETAEIVTGVADPRVRMIRLPQKAPALGAVLNAGIRVARGHVVARMDADDEAMSHRFQCQWSYLKRHGDVGVVGSAALGRRPGSDGLEMIRPPSTHAAIVWRLQFANAILHPTAFIRRELLLSVGGYDEGLVGIEDYELWCRLSSRTRLANLTEATLWYSLPGSADVIRRRERDASAFASDRLKRRGLTAAPPRVIEAITRLEFSDRQEMIEAISLVSQLASRFRCDSAFRADRRELLDEAVRTLVNIGSRGERNGRDILMAYGSAVKVAPVAAARGAVRRAFSTVPSAQERGDVRRVC